MMVDENLLQQPKPEKVRESLAPAGDKVTSEARNYSLNQMRADGLDGAADLLEAPASMSIDEQVKAYRNTHINMPGERDYDLRQAFEDGAISNEPANLDGGMDFLPEDYYRGSRALSLFNYDQETDSYQFRDVRKRVGAYALKGTYQSIVETLFVDPVAEPLTQIQEQAARGDGETQEEIVGQDKFGAPIYAEVPVNPVDVTPAMVDKTSKALRYYTMPDAIRNLDLDDSNDLGGLVEGMAGIVAEFAADIYTTRSLGTVFKREKAVNWYRKFINRTKDLGDPTVILGEYLFAKSPNAANQGTISSETGEWLERDFGMSGDLVEFLKSTDDTPMSQAISMTIEGMIGMEVLRGMALGGYKFSGMKAATNLIADQMKKAEKMLELANAKAKAG